MTEEPVATVGAVVVRDGRALVLRRSMTRRRAPGRWHLPGGRVAPGETPLEALARALEAATGWAVGSVVACIRAHEWTGDDGLRRTEIDYLVTAERGLDEPQPPNGTHPEHRWVGDAELGVLTEQRSAGDDMVRRIVADGLALARLLRTTA